MMKSNNKQPPDKQTDSMRKWYYIATYLIALVAILGFIFSIIGLRQNSERLTSVAHTLTGLEKNIRSLQNNIEEYNKPLIKFVGYEWALEDSEKPLSCENPPIAIKISYINVSRVPLKINDYEIGVKFGEVNLPFETEYRTKEMILAPGERFTYTYSSDTEMKKYSSRNKSPRSEPLFSVSSMIKFTKIEGDVEYEYQAIHKIPFSCVKKGKSPKFENYGFTSFQTIKENIIPKYKP